MINTETVIFNPALASRSRIVKWIAIVMGISIALFAISAFLATMVWNGLEAGQPAPSFSGHDLNGNAIRLVDPGVNKVPYFYHDVHE